jgi:nitric oxide reductase NorE protein
VTRGRGTPANRQPRFPGHVPGEAGIWMFIFGDMMMFSLFFIIFAYYRQQEVALFEASRLHLNIVFGVINTLLMLSSSWFVASAVRMARVGRGHTASILFGGGFMCGVCFGVVKFFEYGQKFHAGITPATNDFFMYYFIFTGIHFIHVLIGMGVLAFLSAHVRSAPLSGTRIRNIESGASFWHVVDLLWIVLFALLYVVP